MTTSTPPSFDALLAAAAPLQAYKDQLAAFQAGLERRFDADEPIADLLHARADFIDQLLVACWQHFLQEDAQRLCLAAVGGYGRRELHPYSDIDLLLLAETPPAGDPACSDRIAALLQFLWDIGLPPGQSVRTVAECVNEARLDQTVISNLIEARPVCGNHALFQSLQVRLAPEQIWPAPAFFAAKQEEQQARYHKYHDTAYNLEPNVKDGPGGLRDIQTIAWITLRRYGIGSLNQLVELGILSRAEYLELNRARNYLWTIRFALHILAGRAEDRLLFQYQKTLADRFGFLSTVGNQAVEQFMQQHFRTIKGVERLNEMLLQLFDEAMPGRHAAAKAKPVDEHFHSIGGYLEASDPELFQRRPLALLEIFHVLQKRPELRGIRAATIRLIRGSLDLIDDRFRHDPAACRLFLQILREPAGINHQLRSMNRHGVLAAYLPEFANVVGRMQFDLFHVYTVDEHSLFVVRNLRRFALDKHREELPFAHDLFRQIAKPELLYIAGLLHDIAKGSGGDHSELGAAIASAFCRRHGLGDDDTQLVCWLVSQHLLMSLTAQRKDISDPDEVHRFAALVGSVDHLNHLYLLTIADIRATNPNLWNSWKDALLKELYSATRRALRRGLHNPIAQDEICAARRHDAIRLTEQLGLPAAAREAVWANLGEEYFLRFAPEEIAWHTIALAGCSGNNDLPLVLLRPQGHWGSAEVFIYLPCQDRVFASSTAILDQLGLTILDARLITTSHGYALNSYQILEQNNAPINGLMRQTEIAQRLRAGLLAEPGTPPPKVGRRPAARIKHFAIPTQVYFLDDPQGRYTVMELFATDQPGLLSKIGQAYTRHGIRLLNAKISTIGSRAEDVFYITGPDGQPLAEDSAKDRLRDSLVELIGKNE